jgi:hypothetical protein
MTCPTQLARELYAEICALPVWMNDNRCHVIIILVCLRLIQDVNKGFYQFRYQERDNGSTCAENDHRLMRWHAQHNLQENYMQRYVHYLCEWTITGVMWLSWPIKIQMREIPLTSASDVVLCLVLCKWDGPHISVVIIGIQTVANQGNEGTGPV